MEFYRDYSNFRKKLTGHDLKMLVLYSVIGLLLVSIFNGKCLIDLQTIAVSPDEQYVACFETGRGPIIRCFHADGSLAFDYPVLPETSAGGHCTLWFEEDALCVLFYRTDKLIQFNLDGSIRGISDGGNIERPPEFPLFSRQGRKFVFQGNQIGVVYDKRTFVGYWLFGAERYLAITPKNEQIRVVYAWTAKGILSEEVN